MDSSSATLNVEFRSSLCCLISPAASCTGLWVQRGEQGIDLLDVWRWGGSLLLFSYFNSKTRLV